MALENKTTGKVIEQKVRIARGFFAQARGLMFESKKNFDYALVFPLATKTIASASIHCLFVFFPIDVIYLDENKVVVDVKKNVPSFALYRQPDKPSKYFIEVRAGKTDSLKIGDKLEWE